MTPLLKERKTRSEKKSRKKVNYMMKIELLEKLEKLIPLGERSDFVNDAIEEKIIDFSRKKASEWFDAFKKKQNLKLSTNEILKAIRYGRK